MTGASVKGTKVHWLSVQHLSHCVTAASTANALYNFFSLLLFIYSFIYLINGHYCTSFSFTGQYVKKLPMGIKFLSEESEFTLTTELNCSYHMPSTTYLLTKSDVSLMVVQVLPWISVTAKNRFVITVDL